LYEKWLSKAGMETPAPLDKNGIDNNASFRSSRHINQTLHLIIHILHFLSGSLVAKLCARCCKRLDWG